MYKRKIPFEIDCGIKITMEVIGGKWKSCILQSLNKEPMRPSELHKEFSDASPRVINQQLKELEIHGIIQKKIFAEFPPHSQYSITDIGKTLIPIIDQIEKWGDSFRPTMGKILGIKES
ncbi:transcriptional regulator [Apibacter muscae]|uniref:winged helix-turn-helix transcriptional regulator n=1 Tax=Apibacter muscae TaxID=2509004 RepID=UPI0011AE0CA9|nr:helix-turn-helix domain-containing protein [Apibacter muscae]TWP29572.1 transcriptional regulator [Apibacter muscae]